MRHKHVRGIMDNKTNGIDTFLTNNSNFKNIIASGYINFLFGAGVNGTSFPNFGNGFTRTKSALKDCGGNGCNIENELSEVSEADYDNVIQILLDEYNKSIENINPMSESINNLKQLLRITYTLVEKSENRQGSA